MAEPPPGGAVARRPVAFGYLVCVTATVVLVVALELGGGAPQTPPPGVTGPGALTGWGLPVARLAADLTGMLTVGALLSVLLLGREADPDRTRSLLRTAGAASLALAVAATGQLILTASDFAAVPVAQAWSSAAAMDALMASVQGRALLAQLVLAAAGALVLRSPVLPRTWLPASLVGALLAITAPAVAGHSAAGDERTWSVLSLVTHVAAASLWVGGLIALALVAHAVRGTEPRIDLSGAVRRFSALALGCYATVGISGVGSAVLRVGSLAAVIDTAYGRLVLAKAAALGVLGAIGWLHRRHTVPALRTDRPAGRRAFVRLAAVEVLVMVATVGLAVGLARTPPG